MNLDQKNIIAILGIQSLPDDRKLAILNKMTDLLEKRLMLRMLGSLSEKDQEIFAQTLESNQPEQIQEFITAHFPQFEDWVTEETVKFKQELAEFTGNR